MTPKLSRIAKLLVYGAVLLGLVALAGRGLVSRWGTPEIQDIRFQLLPWALGAAFGVLALEFVALAWAKLAHHMTTGDSATLRRLMVVFLYSWLARYVPGRIAEFAGRLYLGRALGLPAAALGWSLVYENALLLLTAFAFVSVTLLPPLIDVAGPPWRYAYLPFLAVGGFAVLHPAVVRKAAQVIMRLQGKPAGELPWVPPLPLLGRLAGLYTLSYALQGLGFYLVVLSLTPYPIGYLPLAAGAYTLAQVAGKVGFLVPAGLGIREGVLVGVLQFTMPLGTAVLVSLVARAWATAVDILVVGSGFAYDHLSHEGVLRKALAGRPAR